MTQNGWLKTLVISLTLLVAALALTLQSRFALIPVAHAQGAQFDYVDIVSPLFLYGGERGLLLLDRRNGNVWFMPQRDNAYQDPKFLLRVPFEKLDNHP